LVFEAVELVCKSRFVLYEQTISLPNDELIKFYMAKSDEFQSGKINFLYTKKYL
jgi:hypothetical protein